MRQKYILSAGHTYISIWAHANFIITSTVKCGIIRTLKAMTFLNAYSYVTLMRLRNCFNLLMYDVLFTFHLMIIEFMYLFLGQKINILFLFRSVDILNIIIE